MVIINEIRQTKRWYPTGMVINYCFKVPDKIYKEMDKNNQKAQDVMATKGAKKKQSSICSQIKIQEEHFHILK